MSENKQSKKMLKELADQTIQTTVKSVRIPLVQLDEMQKKADQYAGGNICAWLRIAGVKYIPGKKDLINV